MNERQFADWMANLRNPAHKKYTGTYVNFRDNNCRCAMGWIDLSKNEKQISDLMDDLVDEGIHGEFINQRIIGCESTLWSHIMSWNDIKRLSLPQIADRLEQLKNERKIVLI